MDDLELTRECAEAMGIELTKCLYKIGAGGAAIYAYSLSDTSYVPYNPLHDDAQAMALLKAFNLAIGRNGAQVKIRLRKKLTSDWHPRSNLNRAICECVARMKGAKGAEG